MQLTVVVAIGVATIAVSLKEVRERKEMKETSKVHHHGGAEDEEDSGAQEDHEGSTVVGSSEVVVGEEVVEVARIMDMMMMAIKEKWKKVALCEDVDVGEVAVGDLGDISADIMEDPDLNLVT